MYWNWRLKNKNKKCGFIYSAEPTDVTSISGPLKWDVFEQLHPHFTGCSWSGGVLLHKHKVRVVAVQGIHRAMRQVLWRVNRGFIHLVGMKKRRDMYKGHQILSWCPDVAFVSVGARTLAPSSASRLWIMFQGAIPIATTRTVEEVLAREWSRTAWPKCLVMPKRRPLVRIHAPGEQSHWSFLEFLRGFKGKPNEYKIF